MVVMEKCKISDVSTLTEQNITDEEKTAAAAAGTEGQRSRCSMLIVYVHEPEGQSLSGPVALAHKQLKLFSESMVKHDLRNILGHINEFR